MPKYAPTAFDDLNGSSIAQAKVNATMTPCLALSSAAGPRIGARNRSQPPLEVINLTPEHRTHRRQRAVMTSRLGYPATSSLTRPFRRRSVARTSRCATMLGPWRRASTSAARCSARASMASRISCPTRSWRAACARVRPAGSRARSRPAQSLGDRGRYPTGWREQGVGRETLGPPNRRTSTTPPAGGASAQASIPRERTWWARPSVPAIIA
jgi:hypothetical protein